MTAVGDMTTNKFQKSSNYMKLNIFLKLFTSREAAWSWEGVGWQGKCADLDPLEWIYLDVQKWIYLDSL